MGSRPRDPGPAPHDPASAALVTDSSGESLRSHGPSASSPATTPLRRARARPRVDLHFVGPLRPECRVPSILEAIKPPVGRRAVASLEPHAPRWLPRMTRVRAGRAKRLSWQSGGGYDRNLVEPRTWSACSHQTPAELRSAGPGSRRRDPSHPSAIEKPSNLIRTKEPIMSVNVLYRTS